MRGDRDRAARPSFDGAAIGSPSTPKLPPLLELGPVSNDGYSSGGGGTPRKAALAGPMAALARGNSIPRRSSQPGASNTTFASSNANSNSGAASPMQLPGSASGRLCVPLELPLPRRSDDGLLSGSGAASPSAGGLGSGPSGFGGPRRPRLSHASSSRAFEGFSVAALGLGLGQGTEAAQGLPGSSSVPAPGVLAAGLSAVGLQHVGAAAAAGAGGAGAGGGGSGGGVGPTLGAVASFRSRRLSSFAGDRPSAAASGSNSPLVQAAVGSPASGRLLFSGNQLLPCPPPVPTAQGFSNISERPAQLSSPISPHASLIPGHGFGGSSPMPGSPLSSLANTETGAATQPGSGGRPMQPVPPPPWAAGGAAAGLAARSSKRLLMAAALSSPVMTSGGVAGGGCSTATTASGGLGAPAAAAVAGRVGAVAGGGSPLPRSSYDQISSPFETFSGSAAAAEAAAAPDAGGLGDAAPAPVCVDKRMNVEEEGDELQERGSGPPRASYSGMPSFQFRIESSGLDWGGASGSPNASPQVRSSSKRLTATQEHVDVQLHLVGSGGAVGPATWTPVGLPSPSPPGPVAGGGSQKQLLRRMGSQRRPGLATQTSLSASAGGAGVAATSGGSMTR
ncbi:hypothetical protein HXX76_016183 [Chlamydomonas incerta]|uniref:Uncharacterized protein n=1 Tax=Chlamydomonas incerta TaxID=51695 RepID=A0A835VNT9_CHLIN|nr:hypothetical protein HXX76_016183 [Chlamydomonas incerta]|eukprot:KAG2422230.1 hypothetical protein HXX76_016183 [Chlamydomonas incerta]